MRESLKEAVRSHFKARGRHFLPWRKVNTLYVVLVSEMMLQQTQVERVLPKFEAFVRRFPNFEALASAEISEVYRHWQGLGYNRRAKYLRDAARAIVASGRKPNSVEELIELPGVGPYTAGAVAAFAFGNPDPFVETNIRTAVIYHCFKHTRAVRDAEILSVLDSLRPRRGEAARSWYAALMDYGAHLKKSGVRLNSRSIAYARQSTFQGSLRQLRGAILRELSIKPRNENQLAKLAKRTRKDVLKALAGLERDGLVEKRRASYHVAA